LLCYNTYTETLTAGTAMKRAAKSKDWFETNTTYKFLGILWSMYFMSWIILAFNYIDSASNTITPTLWAIISVFVATYGFPPLVLFSVLLLILRFFLKYF
jgi:hypothetical protein